jgi:glycerophosphoryl diester phosphodiesterase
MVHSWTFRDDANLYGFKDPKAEAAYYMKLGLDGVFTDFTASAVAARNSLR